MSITMIIILFIGTWAMMMPMFFQARKYDIQRWKIIPVAFILTIVGTLGTYIWFLIENFSWGGRSFYGAVFIVPIVFLALPKIIKIPYGQLVDLCAPAECIMLSLMKVQCLVSGCCAGRTLFMTEAGEIVRFPSQAVELAAAYVIAIVLLILSHRKGCRRRCVSHRRERIESGWPDGQHRRYGQPGGSHRLRSENRLGDRGYE